jgi:predicted dehydrogenase
MMSTHAPRPVCVVVGSGSAGRRHATTLRSLLPEHRLVVVRRATSHQPVEALAPLDVDIVGSAAEAAALGPELAVVAGPATRHAADGAFLLAAGAALLVEKPLAASSQDGAALAAAAVAAGRPVVVGYHLRFDDVAGAFVRLVHERAARPTSFELRVGQDLGSWRPGVPAERSVSARQDLGGGVLLELSHEIDAVLAAFGPVAAVRAQLRHDGAPTDGVVETVADLELTLASGGVGRVHLDMVSDPPFRTWHAEAPDVQIDADLLAGTVRAVGGGDRVHEQVAPGGRDRAELRLVRHALAVAAGQEPARCSVDDGLAVLAVIDAARASAADGGGAVDVRPVAQASEVGGWA